MAADRIAEARRVISNEISKTQEIITSYIENKMADLDEIITEVLDELAAVTQEA